VFFSKKITALLYKRKRWAMPHAGSAIAYIKAGLKYIPGANEGQGCSLNTTGDIRLNAQQD